jgi:hypothetical protein
MCTRVIYFYKSDYLVYKISLPFMYCFYNVFQASHLREYIGISSEQCIQLVSVSPQPCVCTPPFSNMLEIQIIALNLTAALSTCNYQFLIFGKGNCLSSMGLFVC